MRLRAASITTVAFAALLLAFAARPAAAQVDPAELAASDVVVDPAAGLSENDRSRLAAAALNARNRGVPTKFVVVGQRPLNPPEAAQRLRRSLGFNGNVLLLSQSPRSLGIGSALSGAATQQSFERALPTLQADPVGGMIEVAERLAAASSSAGGAGSPAGTSRPATRRDSGGGSGLLLIGLLFAGAFLLVPIMRRSGRRRAEADLSDQQAALEPLVDALAAQIGELDSDVQLGGDRGKEARPHYDEAVLAYGEVREAMASPGAAARLRTIRHTLERGLRGAQAARAILDGRPPPAADDAPLLGGMCTFDPKHGRAVRDVRVATPAGDEATIPVCSRCAEGLAHGDSPEIRRVPYHGQEVPYWQPVQTFGFGGGLFPMFGGLLGGMMLHDVLTPDVTVIDSGDFGGFGGGDFGGFGGGGGGGGDF